MNRLRTAARALCGVWGILCAGSATLAATHGRVVDLNNQGLPGAMVTLTRAAHAQGPTALTVFADEHGAFAFLSAQRAPGGADRTAAGIPAAAGRNDRHRAARRHAAHAAGREPGRHGARLGLPARYA